MHIRNMFLTFMSTKQLDIMKRRLFNIAHAIKANYSTFAEALRQAWQIIKLQFKLCTGVAEFTFRKTDGSIREAVGTLYNLPAGAVKGTGKPTNYGILTYWDLEKNAWRSAQIWSLIF